MAFYFEAAQPVFPTARIAPIAVAPGANGRLAPDDVMAAERVIKEADGVLLQLEIPLETVRAAVKLARRYGVRVIVNSTPATQLPDDLLKITDFAYAFSKPVGLPNGH